LNSFTDLDVHTFSTGNELIENLTINPDIVIVDLMLPDITGYELIRIIREYNPAIRIIVVSAQRDIDMVAKVQAEGVYNYLVKSEAAIKYLKEVIEDLLILIDKKGRVYNRWSTGRRRNESADIKTNASKKRTRQKV